MERSKQEEHQEDIQQRHFHSSQPKSNNNKPHQYPTRSKTVENEAETKAEGKKSCFSEIKGSNLILYLNSLSSFFATN